MQQVKDRIIDAHKREIADEKRISDAVIKSLRDKKLEMAGEIAAKEAEIAKLNRKVYEYEKLLASSPIGLIYQLGICNQSVTNCNRLGNASKMRDALEIIAEYAKAAACNTEDAHLLGYLNQIAMWAEAALSAPPRNCDRPECVTTKEAQEVWRKEDGGNTAYYEWLLETSTKGETNEAY